MANTLTFARRYDTFNNNNQTINACVKTIYKISKSQCRISGNFFCKNVRKNSLGMDLVWCSVHIVQLNILSI